MKYFLKRTRLYGYELRNEKQHADKYGWANTASFCAREFHKVTGFRLKYNESREVRIRIEEV